MCRPVYVYVCIYIYIYICIHRHIQGDIWENDPWQNRDISEKIYTVAQFFQYVQPIHFGTEHQIFNSVYVCVQKSQDASQQIQKSTLANMANP